jgi:hypothetical protein
MRRHGSGRTAKTRRRRAIKPKVRTAPSETAFTEKDLFHLSRRRDGLRLILETALDAVVIIKSDGTASDSISNLVVRLPSNALKLPYSNNSLVVIFVTAILPCTLYQRRSS